MFLISVVNASVMNLASIANDAAHMQTKITFPKNVYSKLKAIKNPTGLFSSNGNLEKMRFFKEFK